MPVSRNGGVSRLAKSPVSFAPGPDHRGSLEGDGAGLLQCGNHSDPVEEPDRLGAHVFGAGLVAGKPGPIDDVDPHAGARELPGQRAAGGTGPRDQHLRRRGGQIRPDGSHRNSALVSREDESGERGCPGRHEVHAVVAQPRESSHRSGPAAAAMDPSLGGSPAGGTEEAALECGAEQGVEQHPADATQERNHADGGASSDQGGDRSPRPRRRSRRPPVPRQVTPPLLPAGTGRPSAGSEAACGSRPPTRWPRCRPPRPRVPPPRRSTRPAGHEMQRRRRPRRRRWPAPASRPAALPWHRTWPRDPAASATRGWWG